MTEPATHRPVAKPDSVRRLGPVDVAPLRAQVARLSEKVWRQIIQRRRGWDGTTP